MRPLSLALTLALMPVVLPAQQSPVRPGTTHPLEIGAVAPDFSLRGATRYGVLHDAHEPVSELQERSATSCISARRQ
jgi:hypothetical protein